ncbi:hypothetical protein [Pelomonas sp. BJYL3]|uniref:hypothetical protein n=1 Tax=Pelomonas sp. BJYL3 TaxID=2976697 RepID=UPI0022B2BFFF|nr:hypothetical protein [Pelomonas sp. BJYL3]
MRLTRCFIASLLAAALPACADDAFSELIYVCDAPSSTVTVSRVDAQADARLKAARARGQQVERVDVSPLIHRTRQTSADGSPFRGASDTLVKTCGDFTVTLAGGYLNANPDGAEGVYEWPLVSIEHRSGKRFPTLTLGRCDASFARFSRTTACPMAWATEIRAFLLDGHGRREPVLSLEHQFSDGRGLQDTP